MGALGEQDELGEVVSIHRVRERNGPAEPLAAARVVAGYGIEGDWRSHRATSRQLTLIEEEALLAAGSTLGRTVPPGASRRQVVVRRLALNPTVGKTLRIGDLVLAVTGQCDPCNNMEDKIAPGARAALANRGGVCARVVEGGILRVGDAVRVEAPAGPAPRTHGGAGTLAGTPWPIGPVVPRLGPVAGRAAQGAPGPGTPAEPAAR